MRGQYDILKRRTRPVDEYQTSSLSGGSSNGAILIAVYFYQLRTSQRLAQVRLPGALGRASGITVVQLRTQMPDSDSSKFQPAAGSLHCGGVLQAARDSWHTFASAPHDIARPASAMSAANSDDGSTAHTNPERKPPSPEAS